MVFDFACNGHLHISFAQKKYCFYVFMEIYNRWSLALVNGQVKEVCHLCYPGDEIDFYRWLGYIPASVIFFLERYLLWLIKI